MSLTFCSFYHSLSLYFFSFSSIKYVTLCAKTPIVKVVLMFITPPPNPSKCGQSANQKKTYTRFSTKPPPKTNTTDLVSCNHRDPLSYNLNVT